MNDPTTKSDSTTATQAVRSTIAIALLAAGSLSVALPGQAALQNGALLTIATPTNGGGTVQPPNGSYFGMNTPYGLLYTPIVQGAAGGLILGTTQSTTPSHSGLPTAGDTGGIDKGWNFFNNTGLDFTVTPTNVLTASGNTATVNFNGWRVTWNGIASINMGGGTQVYNGITYNNGTGIATITCNAGCVDGDTYTLDYAAVVPQGDPSNFGGVAYTLRLAGTIVLAPRAADDSSITTVGRAVFIDVLVNDAAPKGVDPTTVNVVSPTVQGGTAVANPTTGVVTYTPPASFNGTDTFTYTFKDKSSPTPVISNTATVTITVQTNVAPTANADTATVIVGTSTAIDVLANDTDPNGTTTLGNIDPASVVIATQPTLGTFSVNSTTGIVTYTAGTTPGADSFTYTVKDADGAISNAATVNLTVQPWSGNWTTPIAAGTVPMLMIESGSYFTMQMTKTTTLTTPLSAGADSGVILGMEQYAAGSHTGVPKNPATEVTGIDQPWNFFSNTGMHYTKNGGIGVNGDGTLDFADKWFVTWNGIPAINMGGDANQDSPVVRGKAAITCSNPAPCADGSTYTLNYMAHVPIGDPSGFGGVPYGLHLQGHVRFLNTGLTGTGTISANPASLNALRVTAAQVAPDAAAGTQCVGDCFDFRVTGFGANGNRAQVVLPLKFGIRPNSTYRKYIGSWRDFDITTLGAGGVADTIKSAPLLKIAGLTTGDCPPAGDSSFTPGLTAGNRCVQLDITDGGLNDADGAANGTIVDPSGVAAAAVVAPADTRTTGSSGCSLSADPVSILKRADWLLLLGFVGWLGLLAARRKRAS